MELPVLDKRTKEDIIKRVEELAAQYLPEWRFERDSDDPAAALTELFSEMFVQSVDRYNAVPLKLYTEFLNLLGVQEPVPVPASGTLQFTVHEGVDEKITIPEGTQFFITGEDSAPVIYETDHTLDASPAALKSVYYVDPRQGIIQKINHGKVQPFFGPTDAENLQHHTFLISHDEVLSVNGNGVIEIYISAGSSQVTDSVMDRLTDQGCALWYYMSGGKWTAFDSVKKDTSRIILVKENAVPMDRDETGRFTVRLDMKKMSGNITVDKVSVSSSSLSPVKVAEMIYDDMPIEPETGGYCFGKIPALFDSFYLRSDEVFSKRGAEVLLCFDMDFIKHTDVELAPQYNFSRSVIDKNQAVSVKPDDVYVSKVVWEYFNGTGWSVLNVSGNRNLFSGKDDGNLQIKFTVPDNIKTVAQTTEEGYFIRARVADIENQYSTIPNYILPFIKGVDLSFSYPSPRVPQVLQAENCGSITKLSAEDTSEGYSLTIYEDLEQRARSMYLCFDKSPCGLPMTIMFDINGRVDLGDKVIYEVYNGGEFKNVAVEDGTHDMQHSGIVSLYIQDAEQADFFSETGYWIRMSLRSVNAALVLPNVAGIYLNTARCIQREHSDEITVSTEIHEVAKRVVIPYTPILSCDLWVDEAGSILESEVNDLLKNNPEDIRVERENDTIKSCLVRWKQEPSLNMAGRNDRVYELDAFTGVLTFGNGVMGRVPSPGNSNIHINVTYGGGIKGNAPIGSIEGFLASVPRISDVVNITPLSGGVDRMPRERLENYGNRRLRHRNRAVSQRDYEEIVLENFPQVQQVRCFSDTDSQGNPAQGHVCVVVRSGGNDDKDIRWELCRSIKQYLIKRCDCLLAASGRLDVRPSIEMAVNVNIKIVAKDPSKLVKTQQDIMDTLKSIIEDKWAKREIGSQIRISEVYSEVSRIPNVAGISKLLIEGVYYSEGVRYVVPVDNDSVHEFITVTNGEHRIRT